MGLTRKQTLFVAEYLLHFNATRAALAAGYSPRTAYRTGFENLRKPQICKALRESIEARMERLQMSQDDVLRELAFLGQSDVSHYKIDDDGNFALADGAPEGAMRAVASVKQRVTYDEDGGRTAHVEFRLWDKVSSLHLMARHLGMLHDKLEHSGKVEGDLAGKDIEELRRMADEFQQKK
jgi:phage terminase small subunit